jgi:hypothetical protein
MFTPLSVVEFTELVSLKARTVVINRISTTITLRKALPDAYEKRFIKRMERFFGV